MTGLSGISVQNVVRIVRYVCSKFVVQISSQLSWRGIVRRLQPSLIACGTDASSHCLLAMLVKPQPGFQGDHFVLKYYMEGDVPQTSFKENGFSFEGSQLQVLVVEFHRGHCKNLGLPD